jgi:hypothetical protein
MVRASARRHVLTARPASSALCDFAEVSRTGLRPGLRHPLNWMSRIGAMDGLRRCRSGRAAGKSGSTGFQTTCWLRQAERGWSRPPPERLTLRTGGGHNFPQEAPEAFARAVSSCARSDES